MQNKMRSSDIPSGWRHQNYQNLCWNSDFFSTDGFRRICKTDLTQENTPGLCARSCSEEQAELRLSSTPRSWLSLVLGSGAVMRLARVKTWKIWALKRLDKFNLAPLSFVFLTALFFQGLMLISCSRKSLYNTSTCRMSAEASLENCKAKNAAFKKVLS